MHTAPPGSPAAAESEEDSPRFSRALLALTAAATIAAAPLAAAAIGPAASGQSAHSIPVYLISRVSHDIGHNDWAFQGQNAGRVDWVVSYVALGLFWLIIALWMRSRVRSSVTRVAGAGAESKPAAAMGDPDCSRLLRQPGLWRPITTFWMRSRARSSVMRVAEAEARDLDGLDRSRELRQPGLWRPITTLWMRIRVRSSATRVAEAEAEMRELDGPDGLDRSRQLRQPRLWWPISTLWMRTRARGSVTSVAEAGAETEARDLDDLDRSRELRQLRLWRRVLLVAWSVEAVTGFLTLGAGAYAAWTSTPLGPTVLRAADLCSPWWSCVAAVLVVARAERSTTALRAILGYALLLAIVLLIPLPGPESVKVLLLALPAAIPALMAADSAPLVTREVRQDAVAAG